MRVALINPYYERYLGPITDNFLPPLDLVNCATILKKAGFEVSLIDANILRLLPIEAAKRTATCDVVVIATSPQNTWQCPPLEIAPFYNTVAAVKRNSPQPFVIAVGPSSLFNAEKLAEACDLVVLGQPEPFFEKLKPEMRTEVYLMLEGIAYRQQGRLVQKRQFAWYDLAKMPQPEFGMLPPLAYRYPVLNGPIMMAETSRGCPERCAFCFQGMTNYTFSAKRPEQVINELTHIRKKLEIRSVFFTDLDISVVKENFRAWMQSLVAMKSDISWACQIRMSAMDDPALVELMAAAGCVGVMVGLESATRKAFEALPKNKDKDYIYRKVRELQQKGIRVLGFFLLGSQYEETTEDIEHTMRYASWLGLDYATFQIAIPYPTTRFYDEVKGLSKEASPENIPLAYQKHFTYKQLESFRRKAYLRFYLNPGYILRNLGFLLKPRDLARNLWVFYDAVRGG